MMPLCNILGSFLTPKPCGGTAPAYSHICVSFQNGTYD
jgi:hypothetical protein